MRWNCSLICGCGRLQTIKLQKQLLGLGLNQQVQLCDMRASYLANEDVLLESNLPSRDPFEVFHVWFEQASSECRSFEEANAVCLSTAASDGKPSSRMVLLKNYSQLGFKFFSCFSSRKANELASNPNAAMLFYWPSFHKQIRIEGRVEKLPDAVADEYWPTRPLESRLSAFISRQSRPVASRQALEAAKSEARDQWVVAGDGTVPRPEHWGGYILQPVYFEFWQGQSDRLHDRIVFRRPTPPDAPAEPQISGSPDELGLGSSSNWLIERLQP